MRLRRRTITMLLCVAMGVTTTATQEALAQTSPEDAAIAQALYEEAQDLARGGKFEEACPKFAEVDRLDPTKDNSYWLADCYEHIGRIASAWSIFVAISGAEQRDGRASHAQEARRRADILKPVLPNVTFVVSAELARTVLLEVTRNGIRVGEGSWNQSLPLDPGDHKVVVKAPGKQTWQQIYTVEQGKPLTIDIPALRDEVRPQPIGVAGLVAQSPRVIDKPMPNRRLAAIVTGGVGVTGLAVGTAFGIVALNTWNEARSYCLGNDTSNCKPGAEKGEQDARIFAGVSTAGFIVGGVGLATAGILWLTTPSASRPGLAISPSTGRGSLGALARINF